MRWAALFRYTSTGILECASTFCVALPSSRGVAAPHPRALLEAERPDLVVAIGLGLAAGLHIRQAVQVVAECASADSDDGEAACSLRSSLARLDRPESLAEVLHAAGLRTLKQLASTEVAELQKILKAAGGNKYARNDPSSWPQQARLMVEGKKAELHALQETLRAGRSKV